MQVPVRLLSDTARMPSRAHADDAAFDLHADETMQLGPARVRRSRRARARPPGGDQRARAAPFRARGAARVTVLNAPG